MATKIGVGLSLLDNSSQAGEEALKAALKEFETRDDCLILVFATSNYDHVLLLQAIGEQIDTHNLVGFSVAGVFTAEQMAKKGVAVFVLQGTGLDFYCAVEIGLSQGQEAAGFALGEKFRQVLQQTDKNCLQLLFPDGLTNTVSCMLDALFQYIGSRTSYAGGASGDNFRFVETFQYVGGQVFKDALVGALVCSDKTIAVAAAHGWTPVSSPMMVTRAAGNTIQELDWQAAYDVYKAFAADVENVDLDTVGFAEFSMRHPFGIPQAKEGDEYIVRDPVAKNEDGSITCVGEVPVNSVLRILRGDKESLMRAVKNASKALLDQLADQPLAGVLVFSCASRCLLLEDGFFDEITVIREVVGEQVPICGCMTYGEIGTIGDGPPEFHNKSVVICAFPQ